MTDKNLFRKLEKTWCNRSRRDVRKNYAYHKNIRHNTVKYNALRDEIEILIQVGYFREFLENKTQVANTNERPR